MFASAAISVEKTIAETIAPFLRQEETMMDIEVPDYNALKKIPSGSTISLFPDNARLYNMDNVETKVLYPDNVDNWKDAVGDGNYWFLHNEGVQEDDRRQFGPNTIEREKTMAGNKQCCFPQARKHYASWLTTIASSTRKVTL